MTTTVNKLVKALYGYEANQALTNRAAQEIERLSTENRFLREVIDSIAGGHSADPQFDALKVRAALG